MRDVFQAAPFGVLITDIAGRDSPIRHVNPAFCAITGYAADEVLGRDPRFLQGPGADPAHVLALRQAIAERRPIRQRILNRRKDGAPLWHELAINPMLTSSGELRGFISLHNDITEAVAAHEQAAATRALLENLTDNIPGFVARLRQSAPGKAEFVFFSGSLNRLLETEEGPRTTDEYFEYVHPDHVEAVRAAVMHGNGSLATMSGEYALITRTGREVWIRASSRPRRLANGDMVWDSCCIDVTAERLARRRLSYLRTHDPLTGLSNRTSFEEKVVERLRQEEPGTTFMLSVVEIDEIAEIRDALGSPAADMLLQMIAERLRGAGAIVARTGEAQFAQLKAFRDSAEANDETLRARLEAPFDIQGSTVAVRPRIGIAYHPAPDSRPLRGPALAAELLKNAQIALVEGRERTPGRVVVYHPAIERRIANRVMFKQQLSQALNLDQFELAFQPQVDLQSREIIGAEALVRWRHPTLGLQLPGVFIPLAEETGAIIALGEWILETAMSQALAWRRRGRNVMVAVNVSSLQIQQPDFSGVVRSLLARTGLAPSQFELELTETLLIESSRAVDDNLDALRAMGVRLAIDDFGSGYASIQYLTRFPVHRVKIDRSLVRAIGAGPHGEAVIRGVLELIRTLNLEAVFEGVETQAQADFLRAQGARIGQGYYFSPPRPPTDLDTLFEATAVELAGERPAHR